MAWWWRKKPRVQPWRFVPQSPAAATSRDEAHAEKHYLRLTPFEKKLFKEMMKLWCKNKQ